MQQCAPFLVCAGVCFNSLSETITLSGRIVDNGSQPNPIPNVTISLKTHNLSTYSDGSGRFSLSVSLTGTRHLSARMGAPWKITGNKISFSLSEKKNIRIGLYDLRGQKQRLLLERTYEAGSYSLPMASLPVKALPAGFYIIKIQAGLQNLTGAFIPVFNNAGISYGNNSLNSGVNPLFLRSSSSASDTISIFRLGYIAKTIPMNAAMPPSLGDIVLNRTAEALDVERKADSLLALMSLPQKAAQMAQAQINAVTDEEIAAGGYGSVFNGGEQPIVPNNAENWATKLDGIQSKIQARDSSLKIPIIYGIDAVHGNAKVVGSTIFPHNIGLGCTYDSALVRKAGEITAEECAAVGIHLTFAPALSVARDERWGRTYEGFGETPEISSMMGCAFLRGLQGNGDISKNVAIAGCIKHYLGDGGTSNGVNLGTVELSDSTMRAVHLPPYNAAIRENPASLMPSFTSWTRNGQAFKQSFDQYTLTQILKQELGFDGFCLSDYNAIPRGCGDGTSADYTEDCVVQSINAGMDMAMIAGANWVVTNYVNAIVSGVNDNKIPIARVNDAVRRILRVKFRMRLWDRVKSDATLRSRMGSDEHRAVARECVRKSLVLLKRTNNVLPLVKNERIAIVGPWANSLGLQCGGWTLNWQGNPRYNKDSLPGATTILEGFQKIGGSNVTFDTTGNNLSQYDKIVLFIGEVPYAESLGDDGFSYASLGYAADADWGGLYENHTISINVSDLPSYGLFTKCAASGKPLICVLMTGRPVIISAGDLSKCQALIAAWLPGSEGGGVADVLYGVCNFSGRLTHTWPAAKEQIPVNAGPIYSDERHGNGETPLFPIGHGLRY